MSGVDERLAYYNGSIIALKGIIEALEEDRTTNQSLGADGRLVQDNCIAIVNSHLAVELASQKRYVNNLN